MLNSLIARFGLRAVQIASVVLTVIALVAVLLLANKCGADRREREKAAQAGQTVSSGEAITAAANDAVNTVQKRSDVENEIDAAVAVAQRNINDAQDPDQVRAAVVRALCVRADHRNDPACRVQ